MANIKAVAERARVSTATVSRYVNHKRVSPAAEQRILAAIQELGYRPSRVARGLKLKQTLTLGVVIPDITNPFFPAVVKGVEDTARAAGFTLVLMNAGEDEDREWACLEALQAQRCDGALLIPAPAVPHHAARRRQLQQFPLPLVYVDRTPDFEADCVFADNVHSAQEAVRHLLRLGHTRIACLTPDFDVSVHRERLAGYRHALVDANLRLAPEYEARAAPSVADGYSAMSNLLALSERPSAIFITSNRLTIGAIAAIESHGVRCPDDISVLGYDSYDWQDVFHPRLTTVAQPTYLMGKRATELLISRIKGERTGRPIQIVLQSNLIVRESCGLYRRDRDSHSNHPTTGLNTRT